MVNELFRSLQNRFGSESYILENTRNETLLVAKRGANILTDIKEIERVMERYFPDTSCHVYELTDDDAFKRRYSKTVSIDFELGGTYSQYFILVYEIPAQINLSFRRGKLTLENDQRDKYISFVKHMFEDRDL